MSSGNKLQRQKNGPWSIGEREKDKGNVPLGCRRKRHGSAPQRESELGPLSRGYLSGGLKGRSQ